MKRQNWLHNGVMISLAVAAGYYLLLGPTSVREYIKHRWVLHKKQIKITQLKEEIDVLNTATTAWANNPMQAQTVARQDLGMGYTNERVYVVTK
jgi:hypothetical protein